MSIALIVCLALGAIGTYGSVLVPGYEAGSLYSGYDGAYAQKYHNYEKSYAFEYGVADPHTGDHKTQWETKDKEGTVRGSYSLLEPDGSTRIVDYIADEHGFRAVVKKVGIHGTTVESHGGAEEHAAPEVALAAAPLAHVEAQPTIIEEPIAYRSYDGGYEDYSGLKPVVADVYTKPIEYVQAPKAELIINVPDHHEEYPSSYSEHTPLYPKVALPEEYWSQEYIPQEKYIVPQEKYVLPQEKYILPQEKYVLPQEKYVLPQEKYVLHQDKYVLPQEKYVLPQEKYVLPQEKYVVPQEYHAPAADYVLPAPKHIQEYIVPEYKIAQEHYAPVPAPIPEYKEYQAPIDYQVPQISKEYIPLEKGAYSYVQEQRYNTPKGKAVFVEGPKIAYVEAPKQAYLPAPSPVVVPSSHAQYNLNVDYHY